MMIYLGLADLIGNGLPALLISIVYFENELLVLLVAIAYNN
jgi:hypothetical protein